MHIGIVANKIIYNFYCTRPKIVVKKITFTTFYESQNKYLKAI